MSPAAILARAQYLPGPVIGRLVTACEFDPAGFRIAYQCLKAASGDGGLEKFEERVHFPASFLVWARAIELANSVKRKRDDG